MKYLVVIDVQNDYVTGSLGSPEAQAALPTMEYVVDQTRKEGDTAIVFAKDTHDIDYFSTFEGQKYPCHCVKNTKGWDIAGSLYKDGDVTVEKPYYGYLHWEDVIVDPEEITVFGFCTDHCVIVNTLMLRSLFPGVKINVIANCCVGTSPEAHNAAIRTMGSCQIDVIYKYNLPMYIAR